MSHPIKTLFYYSNWCTQL